jgi:Skp family chaperone for outer membrane proteins
MNKIKAVSRTIRVLAIAFAFFIVTIASYAQTSQKVAIINSQKAFDQSAEGKKAVSVLQEKEEGIKSDLKKMDEELKVLKDRLAGQKLTLNQEALSQLQLEIDKKEAARQRFEQESSRDYEQFKSQLIKRIRDEMLVIIDALIKERGYDLVFDLSTSGLIHYNPAFDITDEVIKKYDASKAMKK